MLADPDSLSEMTLKSDAEKAAKKLLADTGWAGRIPVDPAKIARTLGLSVVEAQLPESVSGALVKDPGRDPSILLSADDGSNRQRFTCAHEIGHWLRESKGSNAYQFIKYRDPKSSQGTDWEEIFANAFGAALLMPENEVKKLKRDGLDEIQLSLRFGVSRDAMHNRLVNLNLIKS